MERTRSLLQFIYKFPLSPLAPDLWRGQEIHFSLYISFLLALLAPALWRGQEIQFSLYLSLYKFPLSMKLSSALLLAFIAKDLR